MEQKKTSVIDSSESGTQSIQLNEKERKDILREVEIQQTEFGIPQ